MEIDNLHFRSKFGDLQMGIEQGKKENRSEFAFSTFMSDFLDVCTLKCVESTNIQYMLSIAGV